ncbi:MAG: hypothetical protein AB7N76_34155 [Planctomycetota bacterium]
MTEPSEEPDAEPSPKGPRPAPLTPSQRWLAGWLAAMPGLVALVGVAVVMGQAYREGQALHPRQVGFAVILWVLGLGFAVSVSVAVSIVGLLGQLREAHRQRYLPAAIASSVLGLLVVFAACPLTFGPYRAGVRAAYRAMPLEPLRVAARDATAAYSRLGAPVVVWSPGDATWTQAPASVRALTPAPIQVAVGHRGVAFSFQGGPKTPYSGVWVRNDVSLVLAPDEEFPLGQGVSGFFGGAGKDFLGGP